MRLHDLMCAIGDIAAAPLYVAPRIERWYMTTIPKSVRFMLTPVRFAVCAAAAISVVVWVLPFIALHKLYGAWEKFE